MYRFMLQMLTVKLPVAFQHGVLFEVIIETLDSDVLS